MRFRDTTRAVGLAPRQETVSGLRPPPIFVEEEIGMKPQPQRAAAYPYVVVIVRSALVVADTRRRLRRLRHVVVVGSSETFVPIVGYKYPIAGVPRLVVLATLDPTRLGSFSFL